MAKQESLLSKIEEWVGDGLISPEQAKALKWREAEGAAISSASQLRADEIFLPRQSGHLSGAGLPGGAELEGDGEHGQDTLGARSHSPQY